MRLLTEHPKNCFLISVREVIIYIRTSRLILGPTLNPIR